MNKYTLNKMLSEGFGFDGETAEDIDCEVVQLAANNVLRDGIRDLDIKKCLYATTGIVQFKTFEIVYRNIDTGWPELVSTKPFRYKPIRDMQTALAEAGWHFSADIHPYCGFLKSGQPMNRYGSWYAAEVASGNINKQYAKSAQEIAKAQNELVEYQDILDRLPDEFVKYVNDHPMEIYNVGLSKDGGMFWIQLHDLWSNRNNGGPMEGSRIGFTGNAYYRLHEIYNGDKRQADENQAAVMRRLQAKAGKILQRNKWYSRIHSGYDDIQAITGPDGDPIWRLYNNERECRKYMKKLSRGKYPFSEVNLSSLSCQTPDKLYVSNDGSMYIAMYSGAVVQNWIAKNDQGMNNTTDIYPWVNYIGEIATHIIEFGFTDEGLHEIGLL